MDLATISSLFTQSPIDWLILAALAIVLVVDALRSGTGRAAALAVTLPLTLFISALLPRTALINAILTPAASPLFNVAAFFILFGILYFFVYRIMFGPGGVGVPLHIALISGLSATLLTLTFWLMSPTLMSLWTFSPLFVGVFGGGYAFWWLILGFFGLAFTRT